MTDEFGLTRRVQTRRAMERHALSLTRKITRIGWKPMALGVSIDMSVVFVALAAQAVLLKMI